MVLLNKKLSLLRAVFLALGLAMTAQNLQAANNNSSSSEKNIKFGVTCTTSLLVIDINPTLFFE